MFDRDLAKARLHALHAAGEITAAQRLVGAALIRRARRTGVCWPSEATLATDAGVCERTVVRAKRRFTELGFLTWTAKRLGIRQASCTYRMSTPPKPSLGKKTPCLSFPARESGPPPLPRPSADIERALARLGAAIGVRPEAVMPWISAR